MTTHCHFTVPRVKQVRVITDTDFFNEADDPFAVAQALLSPKFDNIALVAAHCGRGAEQMEESYRGLQDMSPQWLWTSRPRFCTVRPMPSPIKRLL